MHMSMTSSCEHTQPHMHTRMHMSMGSVGLDFIVPTVGYLVVFCLDQLELQSQLKATCNLIHFVLRS